MRSAPLSRDLLLRTRVRARKRDALIEMAAGLGEGAPQSLAVSGMVEIRTRICPTPQHERHRRLGELRMALQKAIKA